VNDDNLVVMYHYVRPENSDGVTGLTPEAFREQVRAIAERYRIVTVEEYVATHEQETGLALLTFDDAVSDQYDYAFPVLEDEGHPCVIFAPMRPYSGEEDPWTSAHLLHALAQELGFAELQRRVVALLGDVPLDEAEMNRLYHYEVPEKRRLKYLMSFVLDEAQARATLREVNASVGLKVEDWFMSERELVQVQSAGSAIGGHGFHHVPYHTLTPKEQAADMHRAMREMTRICGAMDRAMAYPFGSHDAHTEAIAGALGYTYCFTVEERVDAKDLFAALHA
jgi:peptidoglycan/xylan/chitin deacetylase (PgdA/CDA1 family)